MFLEYDELAREFKEIIQDIEKNEEEGEEKVKRKWEQFYQDINAL